LKEEALGLGGFTAREYILALEFGEYRLAWTKWSLSIFLIDLKARLFFLNYYFRLVTESALEGLALRIRVAIFLFSFSIFDALNPVFKIYRALS